MPANVSTNEELCISRARHCIGLDRRKPYRRHGKLFYRPFRNHFYTKRNDAVWTEMENAGYAKHWSMNRDGYADFYLTRAGLDWLGEKLGMHIHNEEE